MHWTIPDLGCQGMERCFNWLHVAGRSGGRSALAHNHGRRIGNNVGICNKSPARPLVNGWNFGVWGKTQFATVGEAAEGFGSARGQTLKFLLASGAVGRFPRVNRRLVIVSFFPTSSFRFVALFLFSNCCSFGRGCLWV